MIYFIHTMVLKIIGFREITYLTTSFWQASCNKIIKVFIFFRQEEDKENMVQVTIMEKDVPVCTLWILKLFPS